MEVSKSVRPKGKFLSSEQILQYLICPEKKCIDEDIETMILCKPKGIQLITTDFNVYEALGAVKEDEEFPINRLRKLFETVKIVSYENVKRKPKPVLSEDRVDQLRKSLEVKNGKED